MIDNKDANSKRLGYEDFMRRAFRLSDLPLPDFYYDAIMKDLIDIEQNGNSFLKNPEAFEKYMAIIKPNMEKAMDEYLAMKEIPSADLEELKALKSRISGCNSSSYLLEIIQKVLKLTVSVKEYK